MYSDYIILNKAAGRNFVALAKYSCGVIDVHHTLKRPHPPPRKKSGKGRLIAEKLMSVLEGKGMGYFFLLIYDLLDWN